MTDSREKGRKFELQILNYIKDHLGEHLPEMPKRNLSQYQIKGEADIVIIKLIIHQIMTFRMNTRSSEHVELLQIGQQLTVSIDKDDIIIIPAEEK